MRKLFFILVFLPLLAVQAFAEEADDIVGYWRTIKGNSQFQITKNDNGLYTVTIVWLRFNKDRTDVNNPNPNLKSRKILQLKISDNIVFLKDKNKWAGFIYDPESGNTYHCKMHFDEDQDILKLKGSVKGMRALAHETMCIREKSQRKD